MTNREKQIKMAAQMLKEIGKNTTEATSFSVKYECKDRGTWLDYTIELKPDNGDTFHHLKDSMRIAEAFDLSEYVTFQHSTQQMIVRLFASEDK